MKYLKRFTEHTQYSDFIQTPKYRKPNVSLCKNETEQIKNKVHYEPKDWTKEYFTTVSSVAGTMKGLGNFTSEYSIDGGETWKSIAGSESTETIPANTFVMWRANAVPQVSWGYGIGYFNVTIKDTHIMGNPFSLILGDNFLDESLYSDLPGVGCFGRLFWGMSNLTDASNLGFSNYVRNNCYVQMFARSTGLKHAPKKLPTSTAPGCYNGMFQICTALETPPDELSDISPASAAYNEMFYGCTNLQYTPVIKAEEAIGYSFTFEGMFQNCTSITKAPKLNIRKIAGNGNHLKYMFLGCTSLEDASEIRLFVAAAQKPYEGMFKGCTSLTKPPKLLFKSVPANGCLSMFEGCTSLVAPPQMNVTSLNNECFKNMFKGCTSLVETPNLSATTLKPGCYQSMFEGCTSLTKVSNLPSNFPNQNSYNSMFKGCTSLVKAPDLISTRTYDSYMSDCYKEMFSGCSSLNYIKYLSNQAPQYSENWLEGVSPTGTFEINSTATWDPEEVRGTSGVPEGWEVLKN